MTIGYLLIDGNSIGFAAHSTTKLSVAGRATQAVYGTLKMLRPQISQNAALCPIVLWDGRSWRKNEFAEYKANRDDNPKMKALRDSYKIQRPDISRGLKLLGVWQLMAMNYEADDLAGMLVRKANRDGKKVVMLTADKDWLQLIGERASWYDLTKDKYVDLTNFEEMTRLVEIDKKDGTEKVTPGYKTPRAFLEGKALEGDAGDNIPGVGGIGEKGAREIINRFGSVDEFIATWGSAGKLPKKMADFVTNATGGREKYARNLRLMNLMQGAPAPERLTLTKGSFDEAAFKEFCYEHAFQSLLVNLPEWLEPFRANALERAIAA